MITFLFKPQTIPKLHPFNHRYLQYNHIHVNTKPSKKPTRPHKRTKTQLKKPIPFLTHLKQSQNPDHFLSAFTEFHEQGFKHDYPSYASLVYKLARSKKFNDIPTVLNLLKTRDIKCDEALFIGLIRHYGKAGLVDEAFGVFREMGKGFNCFRTVQSFNTMLNVLVDNERVDDAVKLFGEGKRMRFKLNTVSYNVMMKMWLKAGDWEKSRIVFDEMVERGIEASVVSFNSQIGFLCKRGDVDEAKRVFEDMRKKGRKGNAVTYALLMEGLCGSGEFKEARKMMFDMEYHGVDIALVNYGVLMTDLVRRGLIDEAKGLLGEMKKRRVKPDVVMHNILIDYLCKKGEVDEGYKMLVDMKVNGCEPNAVTYRTVVDGFCRVEDFVGGLKVLNTMLCSRHFPRHETFCCLVVGLVRDGKVDDASFVLEEMAKRKMGLDSDSWEIVVRELCLDDEFVTGRLADVISSG